jgi:hypothetical protein
VAGGSSALTQRGHAPSEVHGGESGAIERRSPVQQGSNRQLAVVITYAQRRYAV